MGSLKVKQKVNKTSGKTRLCFIANIKLLSDGGERSGSVVECSTRDREAVGSSLTGVTALWSLSKTHLS